MFTSTKSGPKDYNPSSLASPLLVLIKLLFRSLHHNFKIVDFFCTMRACLNINKLEWKLLFSGTLYQ